MQGIIAAERRKRGFTLIELLISITILTVIIAILIAIFAGRADKDKAVAEKLVDRARQIAQAARLYMAKEDAKFVPWPDLKTLAEKGYLKYEPYATFPWTVIGPEAVLGWQISPPYCIGAPFCSCPSSYLGLAFGEWNASLCTQLFGQYLGASPTAPNVFLHDYSDIAVEYCDSSLVDDSKRKIKITEGVCKALVSMKEYYYGQQTETRGKFVLVGATSLNSLVVFVPDDIPAGTVIDTYPYNVTTGHCSLLNTGTVSETIFYYLIDEYQWD